MAKLSAHGYEVARVTLAQTEAHGRYERHLSFRSDGHIMLREVGLDVHPRETDPALRRHDWGWKLHKRIKDPKRDTIARMTALAEKTIRVATERGDLKAAKVSNV